MTKGDYPPLRMVIEGGKLSPATPFDAERVDSYRRGTIVNVRLTEDRDRVLVRKWWAVLGLAIKQCETPWKNKEEASEAIKLALGIVNLSKTVGGQYMQYPKSLTELDDPEMTDALEQMMELLHRITGVDPDTLCKEAASVGNDNQKSTEQPTGEREGFSEGFAHAETETLSGDHENHDPDTGEIEDNTNGEASGYPSVTDAAPADAETSSPASDSEAGEVSPPVASPASAQPDKELLIKTFRLLWAAKGPDPSVVDDQAKLLKPDFETANEATKKKAGTIKTQIKMVPEIGEPDVLEYIAGIIGVEPSELVQPAED